MIQIYYAYTDIFPVNSFDNFAEELPQQAKSKLSLLKRDEDKRLLLVSFFLLKRFLNENGFEKFELRNLQYSKTGRPFFKDSSFDFNISHTDSCAAVVFSKECRVGIDIEKIKEVDFSDFTDYFTTAQWEEIFSDGNKLKRFYYYWTLLESGVKADGRGLSIISNKCISFVTDGLLIDNVKWYYNHFDFDNSISCCVTANKQNELYELKNMTSI